MELSSEERRFLQTSHLPNPRYQQRLFMMIPSPSRGSKWSNIYSLQLGIQNPSLKVVGYQTEPCENGLDEEANPSFALLSFKVLLSIHTWSFSTSRIHGLEIHTIPLRFIKCNSLLNLFCMWWAQHLVLSASQYWDYKNEPLHPFWYCSLLTMQRLTRLWGRKQEEHSGKIDLTHEEVWQVLLPYNTTRKYGQKDTQEAKGDKRGVGKVTLNLDSRVPTEGLENTEQFCRKLRKVGFLAGYAEWESVTHREDLGLLAQSCFLILMHGQEPERERRKSIATQLGCNDPGST